MFKSFTNLKSEKIRAQKWDDEPPLGSSSHSSRLFNVLPNQAVTTGPQKRIPDWDFIGNPWKTHRKTQENIVKLWFINFIGDISIVSRMNMVIYPPVMTHIAIEHGPSISLYIYIYHIYVLGFLICIVPKPALSPSWVLIGAVPGRPQSSSQSSHGTMAPGFYSNPSWSSRM